MVFSVVILASTVFILCCRNMSPVDK